MIIEYTKKITEKDLRPFMENNQFLTHIHNEIAYFNVDFQDESGKIELPSNFDLIAIELLKVGVLGELRGSNEDEDGYFAIEKYSTEKINLFYDILFNQENRKNQKQLDEVTGEYMRKGYRIHTIIKELGINNNLVIFNDIEILIHAISIKYPEKIYNQERSIDSLSYSAEIKIYDNLIYDPQNYMFKNPENNKEYNIADSDYVEMMNILLENTSKYVGYDKFDNLNVCKKGGDSREKNKRITDLKDNLFSNIKRNLLIQDEVVHFISVKNGLKITLK